MENDSMLHVHRNKGDELLRLPPGFRFHPTDEELITHYLYQKVVDDSFCTGAIGEVDLNKCEPWDLPWKAKMGEKEWYFFCVRDRKYPTGLRTNRATGSGYWKATGKDREIYRAKTLVGMKKTLVFYKGRAPKGTKTNWVMHEYRLEGKYHVHNLPETAKNEWVICRVCEKSSGGKKVHTSGLMRLTSCGNELKQSPLPSLMDSSSPSNSKMVTTGRSDISHVTCFSKSVEEKKIQQEKVGNNDSNSFNNNSVFSASASLSSKVSPVSALFSKSTVQNSLFSSQFEPTLANLHYQNSAVLISEQQTISRKLLETQGPDTKKSFKSEISQDNGLSPDMSSITINPEMLQISFNDRLAPSSSTGPVDLDCLWNY